MSILSASDVTVHLAGRAVLTGAAIRVAAGEIVGLIGPNGAGKTTLLRVLARLQPATAGSVAFDGAPAAAMPRPRFARAVAYLPQGGESHWAIPVEELVFLGRLPHFGAWRRPSAEDRAAVAAAMAATGIEHLADRPANQLSGGERARVLLARALAGAPRVLLADEPVAGLDPYHRLEVMEHLKALAETGAGIVVVLHDLTLAARFCSRLVLLDRGAVAADGQAEEVLSAERLARIYEISALSGREDGALYVLPWDRLPQQGRPER